MATIPAASEQTIYTWSGEEFYRAGGGICSASDIVVLDYQIPDPAQRTCQLSTCLSTVNGYSSTECISDIGDNLGLKTSQAFGRNATYAQVKFWNKKGCDAMTRMVHYKVNERYSDTNCQNEKKDASIPLNLTVRDCTVQLWNSYYSVDILQTVVIPTLSQSTITNGVSTTSQNADGPKSTITNSVVPTASQNGDGSKSTSGVNPSFPQKDDSPNIVGIVGGVVVAVLVIGAAIGGYFWYSKKNGQKPLPNTFTYTVPPRQPHQIPNQPETVSQPRFSPENSMLVAPAIFDANANVSTVVDIEEKKETILSAIAAEIRSSDEKRPMLNALNAMAAHVHQQPVPQEFHADRAALIEMKVGVDPSKWTFEETAKWLEKNSLGATGGYATVLELVQMEEIDGAALLALSPDDVIKLLGVTVVGRQIKLKSALEKLKQMADGQNHGAAALGNSSAAIPTTIIQPATENPPSYDEGEFQVAA
ncbi:UNVERIFIED_CONTAM: hypothetical protein HDU68_005301 [Siphonaria sp. JEL0065]|nr:hypothetical protein HDU68_005301 [Siphonaria sp. JEL0065]